MRIEQKLSIPLFILAVGSFIDCVVECSPWWHYLAYSGVFILTFAYFIGARTKWIYCIYGAVAFLIVMARFYINTLGFQDLVMFLSGATFFIILYFHFIHPKPETLIAKSGYLAPHIKPLVVDIVHLQIMGYKNDKINAILELSVANDRVRKIVTTEIKDKGFPNRESFIFYLTEKGVFKTMSDEITEGLSNHGTL